MKQRSVIGPEGPSISRTWALSENTSGGRNLFGGPSWGARRAARTTAGGSVCGDGIVARKASSSALKAAVSASIALGRKTEGSRVMDAPPERVTSYKLLVTSYCSVYLQS